MPTSTSLLQGLADSFAHAYGIPIDTAQGLILAVLFMLTVAVAWPAAIRFAFAASEGSASDTTPGVRPELPIEQRIARLSDENLSLREALQRIATRLDANERQCSDLQAEVKKTR